MKGYYWIWLYVLSIVSSITFSVKGSTSVIDILFVGGLFLVSLSHFLFNIYGDAALALPAPKEGVLHRPKQILSICVIPLAPIMIITEYVESLDRIHNVVVILLALAIFLLSVIQIGIICINHDSKQRRKQSIKLAGFVVVVFWLIAKYSIRYR